MPDIVVPARTRSVYTGKVHNPRKIWEEREKDKKLVTQKDFQNSTREMVDKRLKTMEECFNRLTDVCKGLSDGQGLMQAQLDEIRESLGKKPKKIAAEG